MAGVRGVPKMMCVYEHRGHKFYEDWINPGGVLVHLDPKGKEIDSQCYDEDDAREYVENNCMR